MKKVVDVNIAGARFSIEDDAYASLKSYLNRFESNITNKNDAKEIMEDVESRIAEIFLKDIKFQNQTIKIEMVQDLISRMGDFDSDQESEHANLTENKYQQQTNNHSVKRLYRSVDDRRIAGVCGGLAAYFSIDPTLIRIIFLAALLLAGSTFWIYLGIWIIAPKAVTVVQKLEMRGIPTTAENIKNFTNNK